MLRFALCQLFFFLSISVCAQQDTLRHHLSLKGYTDVYVAAFSDSLAPNALQAFTTVSPRDERFGLNVAQITMAYQSAAVRANLTLHWGDIAEATWSEEFKAVQEANVGMLLAKALWLDAGFFATHIGTESFLPKNNFLSATAVATYNEPFFQSGARLSYEGSEHWHGELWVVSGYNYFLDANDAKSVGLLLSYTLSPASSLTYTNLFGRESADGQKPRQFRTYQNLYLNTHWRKKLFLTLGADVGTQSNSRLDDAEAAAYMYNALATVRYQVNPLFSITSRAEVFQDPEGFISGTLLPPTGVSGGLQLWGLTFGGEYRPQENAYLRAETRFLQAADALEIFYAGEPTNQRWEAMITLGYTFSKEFSW